MHVYRLTISLSTSRSISRRPSLRLCFSRRPIEKITHSYRAPELKMHKQMLKSKLKSKKEKLWWQNKKMKEK